ncbi:hypothetical protein KCV07_g545, partial [Aureobasidium melanogenum]
MVSASDPAMYREFINNSTKLCGVSRAPSYRSLMDVRIAWYYSSQLSSHLLLVVAASGVGNISMRRRLLSRRGNMIVISRRYSVLTITVVT